MKQKSPIFQWGFSMLHGTFDNTNYFTFPANAYSQGRNLILEDEYLRIKLFSTGR